MCLLSNTISWLDVKYKEMRINVVSYFKALYLQYCERTDKKQKLEVGQSISTQGYRYCDITAWFSVFMLTAQTLHTNTVHFSMVTY